MLEVKLGDYKKVSGKIEVKKIEDSRIDKELETLQKKSELYYKKRAGAKRG